MSAHHTPGPGPLSVIETEIDPKQFTIKSDWQHTEGDWDDRYVTFGGYFGAYGPHVFAAAPDLLEALEELVACVEYESEPSWASQWDKARSAIAKAKQTTPLCHS